MKLFLFTLAILLPLSANAQAYYANQFNLNGQTEIPEQLQQAKSICESHKHPSNELLLSNPPQISYYYDDGFSKICSDVEKQIYTYNNKEEIRNKKDIDFLKTVVGNSTN